MAMRGYTLKQTRTAEMNPAIKQECIGKTRKVPMKENKYRFAGEMAHTRACGTVPLCHYATRYLHAGESDVTLGRSRRRSRAHTPHHLDPRIFSEPDRIKTLPTPSPPLLQHLHIINLNQLFRRAWGPLHPTLPTLACCGSLLARSR